MRDDTLETAVEKVGSGDVAFGGGDDELDSDGLGVLTFGDQRVDNLLQEG